MKTSLLAIKNALPGKQPYKVHLISLSLFTVALFVPMMGRGFIQDDFFYLYSVAYESLEHGLTHASAGWFYVPLTWLSFKIDWILWGKNAFPFAATNLIIHIGNTLLLYSLAQQLWRSNVVSWWTAFGFALLFPANIPIVMWISTRAHVLAALFYIATLLATLWFARTGQNRIFPAIAVVAFSALSLFSKESSVTIPGAVALIIFYERKSKKHERSISLATIGLFIALFLVVAVYAVLRGRSGALSIAVPNPMTRYGYALSFRLLGLNLSFYIKETYGFLALIALAIGASLFISGRRLSLRLVTKHELLLSVMLFLVMVAPFAFLNVRSSQYCYLPGIGAALLLGAVTNSLYKPTSEAVRYSLLSKLPLALVVTFCVVSTVIASLRWIRMAETNSVVLAQIAAQQPKVKPNTFIALSYSEIDGVNRFPESFATWSFPFAVQVLYSEPSLSGAIVKQGEPYSIDGKIFEADFVYQVSSGKPNVVKQ